MIIIKHWRRCSTGEGVWYNYALEKVVWYNYAKHWTFAMDNDNDKHWRRLCGIMMHWRRLCGIIMH